MFPAPFFRLAAVSPSRQRTFRIMAGCHIVLLGMTLAFMILSAGLHDTMVLGQALLVAGIVEGALLIGWRLTQLPKSQALEFLLVSPLRPVLVFLGEALVGLAQLALVTLAGLPLLLLLVSQGVLYAGDLPALLLLPFIWGSVTGLALTTWAYESVRVRRWGERLIICGVVCYLLVGVLAGENLKLWLEILPLSWSQWFIGSFRAMHEYNPFGVMKFAMEQTPAWSWPRVLWVNELGLLLAAVLGWRGAGRLHVHFQEEHYRPNLIREKHQRSPVGDHPLTWWAIKRVTKYSGRINLWLAGGFALGFAAFTLFQDNWPEWLGRQVFVIFERMGGIPSLTTALVLLAAVPAAFQYGVWDSNASDKCRRLELLLLTQLDGPAYWHASAGAAWKRGRGYFAVALILWAAAWGAGQMSTAQVLASLASGVILWGLYFAIGFWAFSRGIQANAIGIGLTVGVPLATVMLAKGHLDMLMGMLPPGSVYLPGSSFDSWSWMTGATLGALAALFLARWSLARCEGNLRLWYNRR